MIHIYGCIIHNKIITCIYKIDGLNFYFMPTLKNRHSDPIEQWFSTGGARQDGRKKIKKLKNCKKKFITKILS